jgi:hypothetical protein
MPILAQQGMVIALLDNLATIERDEYGCPVLQDQFKLFLDLCLGQWINTGGRFWPRIANIIGFGSRTKKPILLLPQSVQETSCFVDTSTVPGIYARPLGPTP